MYEGGALVKPTDSHAYASLACAVPAELHSINHPDWEIELADLHLGRVVGEGEFGVVHHGMWNGTPVAIKVRSALLRYACLRLACVRALRC